MKTIFRLTAILIFLISQYATAQNAGINNDGSSPHASAMLDIKSASKGVLIPRVALTGANDAVTVSSPAVSLLIYNMATAGTGSNAVDPGFYFWNGTAWAKLNGGSTSSWALGGNAGTNPATHFIGTTDSMPLQFRMNNQPAGKIDRTNSSTFFGYQAGGSITTGSKNIGIGENALNFSTTASDNIAVGYSSLANMVTGGANIGIGKFTLTNTTTGSLNVAVGNHALVNNVNGTENMAIGNEALYFNVTGSKNTAIGASALFRNTASGNTAIGYSSLRNNFNGSDNVAIGNEALFENYTGYRNIAVGNHALSQNLTGMDNVAVGDHALDSNMYYDNTAVGVYSLSRNKNGNGNTALGRNAMFFNANGKYNTGLGFGAIQSNIKGQYNTGIGALSNVGGDSLVYATAIGANSFVACSNCVTFGNEVNTSLKVGISNSHPTQPLSFRDETGGKISLFPGIAGTHYGLGVQGGLLQVYSDLISSDIAFGYGSSSAFSERMRIKGNGFVGIGTNNPLNFLDINGESNYTRAQLRLHETVGETARARFTNGVANQYWEIGGTPSIVSGLANINFYYSDGNINVLNLSGNGNATLAGTLTQNSDARLKKNIQPIPHSLEKLLQLNGYNYNWKDASRDNALQTGVIAQEVQQVLPGLVKEDEKGILSVNYLGLIPVMIESIKTQQKQIEEQQKQINEMKKLILPK